MSNPLIEVLILAAVALFVLSRLYIALGRDDGPPSGRSREAAPATSGDGRRTSSPERSPSFTGPGAGGLAEIHREDRDFNTDEFLAGAKSAYGMIVDAFARGDREALRPLLDDDVFAAWDEAITERETTGQGAFSLIRLKKAAIEDADLADGIARISVRYEAELSDGNRSRSAREIWTYKRPVASDDPNWLLDDVEQAD